MIQELFSGPIDTNQLLLTFLMYMIILFIAFPIHEFAHALAAKILGDRTPDLQGRLTLNPFAHLDLMGSLMMLLFGFGWAKPVETNPNNYTRKISMRGGMALVAFAGPLSNILMALIGMIIYKLLPAEQGELMYAVSLFMQINIFLAVFNLIPIPPLDGSKLMLVILPPRMYAKYESIQRYSFIILMVLIITNILSFVVSLLSRFVIQLLDWMTFFL